jgi:galactokinase
MKIEFILDKFKELYSSEPIIARAPGRVNLIGEHTDYNDGFVLPAAIDKEIVFAIQKNSVNKIRIYSIDMNQQGECDIDNLKPQLGWINYIIGVFSEIQKKGVKIEGTDIVFAGDVPLGAGMSSSAALECAIATGLNQLCNGTLSKLQLALVAQAAEHNFAGVKCGLMDQFASIFGKANHVIKLDCRSQKHEYFPFDFSDFCLVLCDTNVKHSLASSEYNTRREQCEKGVEVIKQKYSYITNLRDVTPEMIAEVKDQIEPVIYNRCLYVVQENIRVEKACEALLKNDFKTFGELMYLSHYGLKDMYEVSCPELDFLVECTKNNPDVLGSRMMGGGFGGCTINLLKTNAVESFLKSIAPKYQQKYGKEMKSYVVRIGEGANVEAKS